MWAGSTPTPSVFSMLACPMLQPFSSARPLRRRRGTSGSPTDRFVARIEKLIEGGLITKQFGDVLDHVRKLGNVGAHASDELVDEASAKKALGFTTQVLRNLFEIPTELNAPESVTTP